MRTLHGSPVRATDMRSTLGRLFMYSKDGEFAAHENFTTEALATNVGLNPAPFLRAIVELDRSQPLGLQLENVDQVIPRTQVDLRTAGIIDLILDLRAGGRTVGELWVEAKIDAPLGERQVRAYLRALEGFSDGLSRALVVLGKSKQTSLVPWLDWRRVYASICQVDDLGWRDFSSFLEETHVADAAMLTITDREAGSLADAHRMFAKVSEVLRAVNEEVCRLWAGKAYSGQVCWTAEGAMLNHAGAIFRSQGRMVVAGNHLQYGVLDDGGSASWYLALRASSTSKSLEDLVGKVRGAVSQDWELHLDSPNFFTRRARVALYPSADEAILWFHAAVTEIHASRLLDSLLANPLITAEPDFPETLDPKSGVLGSEPVP